MVKLQFPFVYFDYFAVKNSVLSPLSRLSNPFSTVVEFFRSQVSAFQLYALPLPSHCATAR